MYFLFLKCRKTDWPSWNGKTSNTNECFVWWSIKKNVEEEEEKRAEEEAKKKTEEETKKKAEEEAKKKAAVEAKKKAEDQAKKKADEASLKKKADTVKNNSHMPVAKKRLTYKEDVELSPSSSSSSQLSDESDSEDTQKDMFKESSG